MCRFPATIVTATATSVITTFAIAATIIGAGIACKIVNSYVHFFTLS
jgi:hypothetical protein